MSGLYIHIPFCEAKCGYCNFFSKVGTNLTVINTYVDALCKELINRQNEINNLETIYIGGGTPSLLNIKHLQKIFNTAENIFNLTNVKEITLEANPQNLDKTYLQDLHSYTPIDRISIGIQSFFDEDLEYLFRKQTGKQSVTAIENILSIGFKNISVDFIFGMPTLSDNHLQKNLEIANSFGVEHISAYSLSIEKKSILSKQITCGKKKNIEENKQINQFFQIDNYLTEHGFEHYETSNYCKNNKYALHNTNYWNRREYLGIGAAAHSFSGNKRQWNIEDIGVYTNNILANNSQKNNLSYEILSDKDHYNEYIMTSIRTQWGISLKYLMENTLYHDYCLQQTKKINPMWISITNDYITTTKNGMIFADKIAEILFAG